MHTIVRKNKTGAEEIVYREEVKFSNKYLGQRFKKSKNSKNKLEVEQWKMATEIEAHEYSNSAHKIFKIAAKNYLDESYATKSIGTIDTYNSYLKNHILPEFGNSFLTDINKSRIAIFNTHLFKKKNLSPKSINLINNIISAIIRENYSQGVIDRDPLVGVKKFREEIDNYDYLRKTEIDFFLKTHAKDKNMPIYRFALNTGMRTGEITGLKWDAINFETSRIAVRSVRDKFGYRLATKSNRIRYIDINWPIREILYPMPRHSDYVFLDENQQPINHSTIGNTFKRLIKKTLEKMHGRDRGRELTFHSLRHTMATHFVLNGGTLEGLQKILGHYSVKETERYAHVLSGDFGGIGKFIEF